ncbi:MAG TPA: GNAT family N-acetyltransferase [Myxococcota bacterium]|jgi:FemAB-related protein (PEP-CTERM system-associated)
MHVEIVADPGAEWDGFVEVTPGAGLGHAAAWHRVLREAYGLAPEYLAVREAGGELAGVLPLVPFRGLLGRLELVSLPFLDTAGVLAVSPAAEAALRDAALARACEIGALGLELRQLAPLAGGPPPGELNRVDLVLALQASEEAQWKALPAKVRNQTRKAEREGLALAAGDPEELLDGFYAPFLRNMRDLGSPVHARRFFAAAAAAFGPRLRFVITALGGRPVGGLVAIDFAGAVTVPWASTLREERQRCPNNQIYWEALRWSIARGARSFDFGRSPPGSGTHGFKLGWGAVERPLAWLRLAPDGRSLELPGPDAGAWLKRLSQVWARLPLALTAQLGPRIRRRLSN